MVKVLNYSQIMVVLRKGFISFDKIVYTLLEADKQYIQANLPVSGSNTFGDGRLLGAVLGSPGSLVTFQPGGPPDPGVVAASSAITTPIPV